MKKTFQIAFTAALLFSIILLSSSCSDDTQSGDPRIHYVRITDPAASDSLLVSAGQGQLIAIIGDNLGKANGIVFNDVPSLLIPVYITNTSVLVSVPTEIPTVLTNTFVLYFEGGDSLTHDFVVSINKPSVTGMDCEYAIDGGTAILYGDYFYEPLVVTFPGDVEAEIVSVEDQTLTIIVPEGAEPGQVSVKSNYGTGKSTFMFRDTRNIVISSDPFTGWWNADFVVSDPGTDDPPLINGNYIRVNQAIGAWAWIEVAGGPADAMGDISKNIPDEAILHPDLYSLKFEVNTVKPYDNNVIKLNFGLTSENNDAYLWNPPYDTEGAWKTVTIPYSEMVAEYVAQGSTMVVSPDGYWTRILFHGPGELDCDISFDNFRIVPNKY